SFFSHLAEKGYSKINFEMGEAYMTQKLYTVKTLENLYESIAYIHRNKFIWIPLCNSQICKCITDFKKIQDNNANILN
ncbi:hypothetical protein HMI55_002664, partial [Coelomomyces lativittatus]